MGRFVAELITGGLDVYDQIQENRRQDREWEARRKEYEAEKERLRELKEAQEEAEREAKRLEEDENSTESQNPEEFRKFVESQQSEDFKKNIKSLNQGWLQKSVEIGLVGLGYAADGAELTQAAAMVVSFMEAGGFAIFLL